LIVHAAGNAQKAFDPACVDVVEAARYDETTKLSSTAALHQ
jgi:hypothetical protein